MIRKVLKFLIIILMIIGIVLGVRIAIRRSFPDINLQKTEEKIISQIQNNNVELLECYTYGRSLNVKGRLQRVSKENIESVKIFLIDGLGYEKTFNLKYDVIDNNLIFESNLEMNNNIILDKLENGVEYYLLLRLKLNNNINPRYFSFDNVGNVPDINYYTVTSGGKNRLAKIGFTEKSIKKNKYSFLSIKLEDSELPEDVYDIVIDAGHGGKDVGEKNGKNTEADITLDYAYALKEQLEKNGYKVELTRTNDNSNTYTYTNMYNENGRITVACRSKAKLMISLHVNNGANVLRGLEIYCPSNCNLAFAKSIADKITEKSSLEYSNSNNYKQSDGLYVRNFTKGEIAESNKSAEKKGYEPYNISEDTSYLYTIREVGGLATNAYVDGRNKDYSKNYYYDSVQGIECYQLELGYIKTNLDILLSEKDKIVEGILEAVLEQY